MGGGFRDSRLHFCLFLIIFCLHKWLLSVPNDNIIHIVIVEISPDCLIRYRPVGIAKTMSMTYY